MNKKLIAVAVLCVIVVSLIAYNEYNVSQELTGTIKVSGAFALYPLMVLWAQQYMKLHPKVNIEVSAGGAGKGMSDALSGLVDIGMISRDITSQETQQGAFYVAVTEGAVVVTISDGNPALNIILTQGITKQMFYNIFVAGNVTTWGQAVGRADITLPIHVYTRSDAAGSADTWAKFLGKKGQGDIKGTGVYGDPGLVQAIQNDPLGIGYNNLAYAYDNSTGMQVQGIKVAPIDFNNNGMIDPSENFYGNKTALVQAIQSGNYPSPPAVNYYLVTKNQFIGVTKDFVKWILTDGQSYVPTAGYVSLTGDVLSAQLTKLEQQGTTT
jgi:phosphate transport system substrate-binding protein